MSYTLIVCKYNFNEVNLESSVNFINENFLDCLRIT